MLVEISMYKGFVVGRGGEVWCGESEKSKGWIVLVGVGEGDIGREYLGFGD